MEQMTSDSTLSLHITRHFSSNPDAVFQAWTDPTALMQWFAPADTYSTPLVEIDLRVGGAYRIQIKSSMGEIHTVGGVYQEISKPERLVFTWAWEEGTDCGGEIMGPMPETLVTVQLREHQGGTELVLTHEQLPTEEARDKHQEGWMGCLTQLGVKVGEA